MLALVKGPMCTHGQRPTHRVQGAPPLGVSSNGAALPSSVINAAMRTGLTPQLTTAFINDSQVRPA